MIQSSADLEHGDGHGSLCLAVPGGQEALFERELSTPLYALVTSAAVLADDLSALTPEQTRARVSGLHRRAVLLHIVAEDLFWATAVAEGRLELHRQEIGLSAIVTEVSAAALPLLSHKKQVLEMALDASALVLIDARRIGQALVTLIHAASEGAAEGSALEIRTDVESRIVRVEVAARQGLASEPPASASTAPVPRAESSSLGLSVARSIVEAHGGVFGGLEGAPYWFELPRS